MGAIIGVTYTVVVVATSIWVSLDSEKYDWREWNHPRHADWHSAAESPATWLVACLLLWPVFFPGYFWDRKFARLKPDTLAERK
jgi:hypothetical protein